MKVVVISGSPRKEAATQHMMRAVHERVAAKNADARFINLAEGGIDYFRGNAEYGEPTMRAARDITEADVWLVGTPIYNSFFSSALKNLFEFIDYKKTPGKVAGLAIMAAGEVGFTDVQTLLTQLMSYFGVVTNPKAVYMTAGMISGGAVADAGALKRLEELADGTLDLAAKVRGA